jgi:hypothetical protein
MFYFFYTFLIPFLVLSQKTMPDSAKSDINVISQQGSLFSLKVVKGQPIKIFVLGREEAEVDLSSLKFDADVNFADLSVSIRQVNPKPGRILKIKRLKKHFEIDEPLLFNHDLELEVDASVKDKKETFKVKVSPPK